MKVLTIRTDTSQAELALYDDSEQLQQITWEAHRTLTDKIHFRIKELLDLQHINYEQVQGIVVFKGPGSFTGLRIGMSVANALAYGLGIPVIAEDTDAWAQKGISRLLAGENDGVALPYYGADAHITAPKK